MTHHQNSGVCPRCQEIFDVFPNFNQSLRDWFLSFQLAHPEFHISCAGRGRVDQEALFARGASLAHYGQSAHNWNCAIDTFIELAGLDLYDLDHYQNVLAPEVADFLNWYGTPHHPFYELPHIELQNWTELKAEEQLELVE